MKKKIMSVLIVALIWTILYFSVRFLVAFVTGDRCHDCGKILVFEYIADGNSYCDECKPAGTYR